jgi:DNA polymerase-1
MDRFFERFPKVKQFQRDSHLEVKSTGVVKNFFGRPRRIPDAKGIPKSIAHADLPYEARNMLNLAVNHKIQSTGASIVNRAAIEFKRLTKEAGIFCKIVVQVHDSLIAECDKRDTKIVSKFLQRAMEETVILQGVRLEAIPKIGTNLSEV